MGSPKNVQIEVIRRQDLAPGDYILIKCAEEDVEEASSWAENFFQKSNCKIGVIYHDMSVVVIKDSTQN